jgi:hypothetical protein
MTIFYPVLNCDLNTLARKVFVLSMSHSNVLSIKNN